MLYFVRVGAPVYRRAWEVLGGTGKICATGKTVLRVRPRTLTNKRGRDVDQGENLKEKKGSTLEALPLLEGETKELLLDP